MQRPPRESSWSTFRSFFQKLACTGIVLPWRATLATMDMRIAHYDVTVDPARAEYDEHCIYVFWHENVAILLPRWGHCPLTLLVSQHRDGEWLAQIAHAFGFGIVRGSTTRGGSSAIRKLKHRSERTSFAITPDGPLGPRRQMAMGPIFLASRLGMPLVPVGIGYDRPYRLRTWDRFAMPRLFSRCRVIFGPKIHISRRANRDQLESYRQHSEQMVNDLDVVAEQWAESGDHLVGQQVFHRVRRCLELKFENRSEEAGITRWSTRHAA